MNLLGNLSSEVTVTGVEGFFGPLYNTWDAPKVLAAISVLLTQTVGNALLLGIIW